MLKQLRSGAAGFFAKLLLGLLVLMFVFWGVRRSGDLSPPAVVATVGSLEISRADFEKEVTILKRSFGDELGGEAGLSIFYRKALQQMIDQDLLQLEAQRLNLLISDDVVVEQISKNPAFQNAAGEFDKLLYQQWLRQNNLYEATYVALLKADLQRILLLSLLETDQIVPAGYDKLLYTIEGETRQVDLIAVNSAPNYKPSEPSTADVERYFDNHKIDFGAPEYRTLEAIRLEPQAILDKVQVSRQELFDLYNQRLPSLMIPEKRDVMQMLYPSKAEAESAYGILRSGKNLKQAVQMVPPANKDSLDLGYLTKEQLPAGGEAVFSLVKGEFTQPIESPFGWHVFEVKDIREKHGTPFDDVKKTLDQELRQQKGESELASTTQQLEDAVAGSASLDEAAKAAGLPLEHLDPVSAQGLGSDNRRILDPSADKELLEAAFRLPSGERSEVVRESSGGYFVVKVDAITQPRQKTLDEVRGQVVAALKSQQLQDARKNYADSLIAVLKQAGSPDAAEKALGGFTADLSKNLTVRRNGNVLGQKNIQLPPALASDIFAQGKPGAVTSAHRLDDKGFVIALVKNIAAAPPPGQGDDVQFDALRRALNKDYENETLGEFIAYLQKRYPVRINEGLLSQLTTQQ